MRTTQFIGLNALAREYTRNHLFLCQNYKTLEGLDNYTYGMFNEIIPLSVWEHIDGSIYKEVVQVEPWSSGPMIFTCLMDEDGNTLFQWILDPELRGRSEVDYEHGRYYV